MLPPDQTIDGLWHLFCHTVHGVYHYTSADGFQWRKVQYLFPNGMCWQSRIVVRTSRDLYHWSRPQEVLSPCLPWHHRPGWGFGPAVSNPCVVRVDGKYRLYYSASLVRLEDCGFNEPAYIGVAEADHIQGPYEPREKPLISPDPSHP